MGATERSFDFQIPEGEARDTLRMFVDTTSMLMLYRQDDLEGVRTPRVSGRQTARDGLITLLKGTVLEPKFKPGDRYVYIGRRAPATDVAEPASPNDSPQMREVLVTGSYLLDVEDIVSPLIIRSTEHIRRAAYATTQDTLQSMPIVSRAGPSEVFDPGGNFGRGSSINLRGLGAGATLTLFNGHRQAPSGANADFVDVSSIPVSAIERIEVLPDGSSALYGSDAIAGIVNIIPRDDLEGAETQARFADVRGGADERLVAQLFGGHWGSAGKGLLVYQYWQRTVLRASARRYAADADKQPLGGRDLSSFFSNPSNLLDPKTGQPAFGIPRDQDGQGLTAANLSEKLNWENSVADTDLLPDVKMHSVYASVSQPLANRISVTAEGRFNQRSIAQRYPPTTAVLIVPNTNPFFIGTKGAENPFNVVAYSFAKDFGPIAASGRTRDYGGALTLSADLSQRWTASLSEAYHRVYLDWTGANQVNFGALSEALGRMDRNSAFNPYGDGSYTDSSTLESIRLSDREQVRSSVNTQTLLVRGRLLDMSTGEAKLAIGVERRNEQLSREGVAPVSTSRIVKSAFTELTLPILGDASRPRATPKVHVGLAWRADQYTDSGAATSPKFTVEAALMPTLKIRGTWGRSFRAPLLTDLYDTSNNRSALRDLADPHSVTGRSVVLIDQRNNPNLSPEKARTWTLGVDLAPTAGYGISLTYYGIAYADRVFRQGSSSISLETILAADEWSALVTRNPTSEKVEAICHSPGFMGAGEQCAATPPAAILDVGPRNLSSTQLRGLDLNLSRSLETRLGTVELTLDASYILQFGEALAQRARAVRVVDTVDHPASRRARATVSWAPRSLAGLSAAVSLDYTGGYSDRVSPKIQNVKSAFNTDVNVSYRSDSGGSEWDNNLELDLNISNLFDQNPPFVDRTLGYDVANARPFGRVIGLYLTKRW